MLNMNGLDLVDCCLSCQAQGDLVSTEIKDISFQPLSDIICIMTPPVVTNEWSQFKLCTEELEKIKSNLKKTHVYFK